MNRVQGCQEKGEVMVLAARRVSYGGSDAAVDAVK